MTAFNERDFLATRFEGTDTYIATEDLRVAVNAAVALERPLLVKGEPGTGKTILAHEIAKALGKDIITWHIKSTTKAQQGLYEYDAVTRLRDGQLGDAKVADIRNYILRGKLWEAFTADAAPVLLIDEIDKADIEFPNDLLLELDRMEFFVYETRETVKARHRPVVIITSNNEKELPDAFLRRCFFHYIRFPDRETMARIVEVHYPGLQKNLLRDALDRLLRGARRAGLEEKALDLGIARLDQAAAGRRHLGRSLARARSRQAHPAALWRAPQERAGRAALRAPRVPPSPRTRDLMLEGFLIELRDAKLPVSLKEFLTLMEAMKRGVAIVARRRFLLSRARRAGEGREASRQIRPRLRALFQRHRERSPMRRWRSRRNG